MSLDARTGCFDSCTQASIRQALTWRLLRNLVLGQVLAVLVCGTAVSSQYLSSAYQVDAPMLQSAIHYALLCLAYTPALFCTRGPRSVFQMSRKRWLQYFLLGLVDVEANYSVVKAYQYTTLTSIQLLDCFVIPVVMILSWWFLKTRYRPVHYVSVCICLLGVSAMVGADLLAGRDQGSTSNILLGDGLVLLSAALYGLSNVWQEYTVKNRSRLEFLGMLGLFGSVISGVQMMALEFHHASVIQWSWHVAVLFGAFACCMFTLYSLMPVIIEDSNAAAINLSMLSADVFSIFCGIFIFRYNFSGLYVVSLVVIFVGFITFNAIPIAPATSDNGGHDNAADEPTKREVELAEEEKSKSIHVVDCTSF
ncbi:solute carrier family 35 member F2-like [Syngnathus typhle]|uniref:solute carrier family 35 member F2-like n=1 Tax=Syngnathus typhle TaxID=161592 RepID=UPI002A6A779D|nr:solute carrier family 35 member F2-like [Syngnathus typhle]